MRTFRNTGIFLVLVVLLNACQKAQEGNPDEIMEVVNIPGDLADPQAIVAVKKLYQRLSDVQRSGIAFGQQDATAYGIGWKHQRFPTDSDVKRVSGDHPAVIGFDLGNIESGSRTNIDGIPFELMKDLMQDAHQRGSIITVSWHAYNPVTGEQPWDITPAIPDFLPGGSMQEDFERYLQRVAAFFNDLKDSDGHPIPVIFRPWHEMNGDWFWWGNVGHTPEDFHRLYRETVRYLSEEGQVHNILYCYSPDRCYSSEQYLTYYPGDDWVDILGLDLYDFNNGWYEVQADTALTVLTDLALARNKVCAFTETGLENLIFSDWWTERLLPVIQDKPIAYVLVWRNAHTRHFFGPYSGHPSAADFRLFAASAEILLHSDLPK